MLGSRGRNRRRIDAAHMHHGNQRLRRSLSGRARHRLVVVRSDFAGPPRIELYANPASTSPQLFQTITGPAMLLPAAAVDFGAATDPATGDIYVYAAGPSVGPRVSVFASNTSGNVAPKRVLTVPDATGWGNRQSGGGSNVLAVDDRGQLYLGLRTNLVVQVYAAGAAEALPRYARSRTHRHRRPIRDSRTWCRRRLQSARPFTDRPLI